MALLVLLALVGAFGDGLLTRATVHAPDASTIAFSRVMRAESPERVRIAGPAARSLVTLVIDSASLSWLTIEATVPRAVAERRGVAQLEFDVEAPAGGSVAVDLVLVPHTIGWHSLRTKLGDAAWTDVRIAVLP